MLVISDCQFGIIPPVSIDNVFVLIIPCEESQRDPKVDLSMLIGFLIKFFYGLPFGPTASDEHLLRVFLALGVPDEAGFFRSAGAVVVVAAVLANGWHFLPLLNIISIGR